jgi:hypothetical protein
MEYQLPKPKNWQDFESICHKLWRDIWCDPDAQKNGRAGQSQCGVDIFGKPIYSGIIAGVQCKDKDAALGSKLTVTELKTECKKATNFKPGIKSFTFATTAPRDASIQIKAREITNASSYPFNVHVWSWDDIEEEIRFRPAIRSAYYQGFKVIPGESTRTIMSCLSARDQFYAFFSRPDVVKLIAPYLRGFLIPLAYELSDNAYLHGKATQFVIACEKTSVFFKDNGASFDPIKKLNPKKVSGSGHIGSYVFFAFANTFGKLVSIHYKREGKGKNQANSIELRFNKALADFGGLKVHNATVEVGLAYGRNAAERLAASIPIPVGTTELILAIGDAAHNLSALAGFILAMLDRLPAGVKLTISLPRHPLTTSFGNWFDDPRLKIQVR